MRKSPVLDMAERKEVRCGAGSAGEEERNGRESSLGEVGR